MINELSACTKECNRQRQRQKGRKGLRRRNIKVYSMKRKSIEGVDRYHVMKDDVKLCHAMVSHLCRGVFGHRKTLDHDSVIERRNSWTPEQPVHNTMCTESLDEKVNSINEVIVAGKSCIWKSGVSDWQINFFDLWGIKYKNHTFKTSKMMHNSVTYRCILILVTRRAGKRIIFDETGNANTRVRSSFPSWLREKKKRKREGESSFVNRINMA